jgi:hypothetical protein
VALDKYVLEFVALIRRKYITTGSELRPLDLARRVSFFVMDFTTDIAFGNPWGCLAKDEDVDKWFESATVVLPIVIMVSTIPWLAKLFSIPIVGKFVGPSEEDKTGPGRILKYSKRTTAGATLLTIIIGLSKRSSAKDSHLRTMNKSET